MKRTQKKKGDCKNLAEGKKKNKEQNGKNSETARGSLAYLI
jgi:hypothetical protein